jgi:hypothetical protein
VSALLKDEQTGRVVTEHNFGGAKASDGGLRAKYMESIYHCGDRFEETDEKNSLFRRLHSLFAQKSYLFLEK